MGRYSELDFRGPLHQGDCLLVFELQFPFNRFLFEQSLPLLLDPLGQIRLVQDHVSSLQDAREEPGLIYFPNNHFAFFEGERSEELAVGMEGNTVNWIVVSFEDFPLEGHLEVVDHYVIVLVRHCEVLSLLVEVREVKALENGFKCFCGKFLAFGSEFRFVGIQGFEEELDE